MKKILYIFALVASFSAIAQDIIPTIGTELCPNQEYTFTVSGLPGNFINLNSIGSVTITQFPSGSGTSITFKAKFGDVNGEQGFEVSYQGGSKPFKYTKIKSLFGGYSENFSNPTTLSVPICQTTPVALNISGNKYWNISTNPYTTFGNITTYKYKIPAGWYLNSTLSTGNNYITATGPVTLTPTANSGNGGLIEYIAKNDCSGAFFEGTPRYITINRPNPTFTLAPNAVAFTCGTPQTRTFTVSTANNISCSLSYTWNLGANNGWLLPNGNPAPANISTQTNTLTLTSANGNILPSNVRVTPVVNGVVYPQLTSNVSWSTFVNSASISGADVVCLGNNTFNLLNLGQNNTVTWSINSAGTAVISSSTQSNVTINATSSGAVEIIATISNPCQQTRIVRKNIWAGTPLISSISLLDFNSFPSSTPYIDPSSASDCPSIGLQLNLPQPLNQIFEIQWERLTQGIFWNRDYGSNGTKDTKVFIYPRGNMNFEYRVRLRNSCGWSGWFDYNHNIESCSYDYSPPINGIEGENFILSPVPVTNGTLQVGLTNNAPWFIIGGDNGGSGSNPSLDPGTGVPYVPASVVVNVSIYNQIGLLVMNLPNRTIPTSIDLNSLPAGTYIINFEYQGQIESNTFVKN